MQDELVGEESNLDAKVMNDILMIALALISILLLILEVTAEISIEQKKVIGYADLGICAIFFGEFSYRFFKSENRALFLRKHWWELLASIPITSEAAQILRGVRLLRIFRLLRLLRLIRFAVRLKILLDASQKFAQQAYLIYIATLVGVVSLCGALGFHYFEVGVNRNVHSFWDSYWWAMVTITTVGYGDIYPVTTPGRIIALILMFSGIGTLGVFTASIAAALLKHQQD